MSAFDDARDALKKLPGVGFRSAERMALHLLAEHPEDLARLLAALSEAAQRVSRCGVCGNLAEDGGICPICADERRDRARVCVVEHIPDLAAIERTGTFRGVFHVLGGRLSPIRGVGPEQLNFAKLEERLAVPLHPRENRRTFSGRRNHAHRLRAAQRRRAQFRRSRDAALGARIAARFLRTRRSRPFRARILLAEAESAA